MLLSQVSFSVNPCYYCYFSCFFPPFPLNALHFFFIYCYFFLLFHCLPAYCYSASPIPLSSLCLSLHCCTLSVLYHISPEELFFPTILWTNFKQEKHHTHKHVHTCVHTVLLVLPGYFFLSSSTVVFIKLK